MKINLNNLNVKFIQVANNTKHVTVITSKAFSKLIFILTEHVSTRTIVYIDFCISLIGSNTFMEESYIVSDILYA